MDLLVEMAAQPGRVFSRDELLDRVWGEVVVGEEVLTRAVSELRRLLADDSRVPRYIETIRKRGYRIIAECQTIPSEPTDDTSPRDGSGEKSTVISVDPAPTGIRRILFGIAIIVGIVAVCLWVYSILRSGGSAADIEATPWHPRPLTSYIGNEVTPALSPDGRLVAFSWTGPQDDNFDIYVLQIGDPSPLRLTEDLAVDIHPVWSPDGKRLAYISDKGPGAEIRIVPVLGGTSHRLLELPFGLGGGFSWSPDGSSIVYATQSAENVSNQLCLVDLETREESVLSAAPTSGRGDIEPEFSPDGRTIAFVRCHSSGLQDLWLISTEGREARCVRAGFLNVMGLEWARNNQELLCPAQHEGSFSLWRVKVDNGEISWSSVLGERIYTPSIARDADRLVYHNYRSERNIWRLELGDQQDSEVEPVVVSTHWDDEPSISPDGRYIAFTSTRSGSTEIWVSRLDAPRPYQLTEFGGGLVAGLRWSPDGGHIAFNASPKGFQELFIVEVDGGRLRHLDSGFDNAFVSDWSIDGQWLYFSAEQEGNWNIWRLNLKSASEPLEVQIAAERGIRGYECTDGYFYYSLPNQAGLWRIPQAQMDGQGPSIDEEHPWLPDFPHVGRWNSWTICQDRLYLSIPDKQDLLVMYLDTMSGRMVEEARLPGPSSSAMALSQDCRTCYYVRIEREHGDLMLVDGFR